MKRPPLPNKGGVPVPLHANQVAERFLRGHGWDESWDEDAVLEDVVRLCKQLRATGQLDVQRVLGFWQALRARRYPQAVVDSSVQISSDEFFVPDDPGSPVL